MTVLGIVFHVELFKLCVAVQSRQLKERGDPRLEWGSTPLKLDESELVLDESELVYATFISVSLQQRHHTSI